MCISLIRGLTMFVLFFILMAVWSILAWQLTYFCSLKGGFHQVEMSDLQRSVSLRGFAKSDVDTRTSKPHIKQFRIKIRKCSSVRPNVKHEHGGWFLNTYLRWNILNQGSHTNFFQSFQPCPSATIIEKYRTSELETWNTIYPL